MTQEESVGDLDRAVGYVLKRAAVALRGAMDVALRPLDLTVPQYACLELLGQWPGQSNAELARGAFVTRQSMNQVLRGLQDRGLVTRPATTAHGRALPTQLTADGQRALRAASAAVARVQRRMVASLTLEQQQRLQQDLATCADSLSDAIRPPPRHIS